MTMLTTPKLCTQCGRTFSCSYKDAPTRDILRSSYAPVLNEQDTLRAEVTAIDASTKAIDAELAAIQARQVALQAMRQQLELDRQLKESLLSPIRHLPFELLELIILHALPENWYTAVCGTVRFPLIQASRQFRATAFAMPALWSTIRTPILRHPPKVKAHFLDAATAYVDRAGDHPVNIVKFQANPSIMPPSHDADMWLSAHMHRIRTLNWQLRGGRFIVPTLSAPVLESLCLRWMPVRGQQQLEKQTITDAPRLRRLGLEGQLLPSQLRLPWARLEELEMDVEGCGPKDLRALEHCHALTTLAIKMRSLSAWMLDEDTQIPIAQLGSLRKLSLRAQGIAYARFLACPALRELEIDVNSTTYPGDLVPLVRTMLQRISPHPLKELTIAIFYPNVDRHFIDLLACTPELRKLHIVADEDRAFSDELLVGLTGTQLVPSLEHLAITLECQCFSMAAGQQLEALALSRWADNGGPPTTRLTLAVDICAQTLGCECELRIDWSRGLEERGILVDRSSCTQSQSEAVRIGFYT
ncbi:hypothetical protein K525DRAFT_243346 [Schizophyllum commune Loenen D]|nr:hypothetical protein K525DRAFT_243346 [Schizophyllum commune Loenen D]